MSTLAVSLITFGVFAAIVVFCVAFAWAIRNADEIGL